MGKVFVSYLLYTLAVTLQLGVSKSTFILQCILTEYQIISIYFELQIELLVYDVL